MQILITSSTLKPSSDCLQLCIERLNLSQEPALAMPTRAHLLGHGPHQILQSGCGAPLLFWSVLAAMHG